MAPIPQNPQVLFLSHVDRSGECWLWTASTTKGGYGKFTSGKTTRVAHRVSFEWWVGPIPEGMHVDHLCRTRNCVRPSHLEAVSPKENVKRSMPHRPAPPATCPRGHSEWSRTPGRTGRRCLACHRESMAAAR